MGIISNTLPQVSAAATPTNLSSTAKAQNALPNTAVQSSAMLEAGGQSKPKATSRGEHRAVDSTFESEKDNKEGKSKDLKNKKSDINVYA